MSSSLIATVVLQAAEESGEPSVSPYLVGFIAFAILMALLIGLVSFGGGREHS